MNLACRDCRQHQRKLGPFAEFADNFDTAAMHLDEKLDHAQSQSQTPAIELKSPEE